MTDRQCYLWADIWKNKDPSLSVLHSFSLFVSPVRSLPLPFVSALVSDGPAVCGIHHLPAPVSYQAWTDLSMTQLPLPLPTVLLNCTLIKLGLLIMMA